MTPLSNRCELREGRLLEISVDAGYHTVDDVEAMIQAIGGQLKRLPMTEQVIIAADWRRVHIMPPDTAARASKMLQSVNPRVLRSALLTVPDHPIMSLQVVRLVRESQNERRKHFVTTTELNRWLGEVLRPAEAARLAAFLPPD